MSPNKGMKLGPLPTVNVKSLKIGARKRCDSCGETRRRLVNVGHEELCIPCHEEQSNGSCGCEYCYDKASNGMGGGLDVDDLD